ncbi:LptA/OstA family protein [Desulfonatronum thioautotrophicum]|uniref:LptA/OstA family protein n=1 Tax=Desulfonatronum thioautotrophicum TaxID=617001 RepID=UPI0005EB340F|nr:LptA/OstA family protein [Desulfonatronum thioautotrophicum]
MKDRLPLFRIVKILAFLGFLTLFLSSDWCHAEQHEEAIPTRITSERLRYAHRDHQIEFIGDVRVDRPNFQLRSERLLVFLRTLPRDERPVGVSSDQDMDAQVDIEKMIALGQVFLKHEERVGHGDMATYWVDQGVLRLEGNARFEEGGTRLEGNVITVNVQEREVDVEGRTDRRVEGMFLLPREQGER